MSEYYTGVIQILISAGAAVDVQDTESGETALMIALELFRHSHAPIEDCNAIIKMLIVAGANLDLQDNEGKTAMNYVTDKTQAVFDQAIAERAQICAIIRAAVQPCLAGIHPLVELVLDYEGMNPKLPQKD